MPQLWRDEHGEIGGIIMFTKVITERKHAESRLRESETLLRDLVETSPIPIHEFPSTGRA